MSKGLEALECLEEMAKYRIEYSEYLMPIKDIISLIEPL